MTNLQSGYVTISSKKYPILWTGQRAQHIAEKVINRESELLHIEIQQALQSAKYFKKQPKKNFTGYAEVDNAIIQVSFEVISKMASIKTAKKTYQTMENLKKNNKRISGSKKPKEQYRKVIVATDEELQKFLDDSESTMTVDECREAANKFLNMPKTKSKKTIFL